MDTHEPTDTAPHRDVRKHGRPRPHTSTPLLTHTHTPSPWRAPSRPRLPIRSGAGGACHGGGGGRRGAIHGDTRARRPRQRPEALPRLARRERRVPGARAAVGTRVGGEGGRRGERLGARELPVSPPLPASPTRQSPSLTHRGRSASKTTPEPPSSSQKALPGRATL